MPADPLPSAAGSAAAARSARSGTRARLLLAFGALALAFAAAFGWLLAGLAGMEEQLRYLHEHEAQMQLALELQAGARAVYFPGRGGGEGAPPPPEARARLQARLARLVAEVDEPEAIGWIARVAAALGALDAGGGDEALRRDLLFTVEEEADRFCAFLRERVAEKSGAVGDLQRRTLRLAIPFVAGTLLLAGLLAAWLSHAIARPLGILGAGAARIGGGDLSTRIALDHRDEFGALATDFNAMAASLERQHEALVRAETLAGLGRVAAGIAHELNNPLQVMLGYLSLDRGKVGGEVGRHLERVEREALRCREIVEALLQLARPAAAPPPEAIDLRALSLEAAEAVRAELGGRAPAIEVRGAAEALGAPGRLRQIVLNLLRNAADAAGPAGAVAVEVAAVAARAELTVADSGPGIPPEVRARLYEPFFTTKPHGTGLGLALSRALATSLGGELVLDGAATGGARFTVRVPLAAARP